MMMLLPVFHVAALFSWPDTTSAGDTQFSKLPVSSCAASLYHSMRPLQLSQHPQSCIYSVWLPSLLASLFAISYYFTFFFKNLFLTFICLYKCVPLKILSCSSAASMPGRRILNFYAAQIPPCPHFYMTRRLSSQGRTTHSLFFHQSHNFHL